MFQKYNPLLCALTIVTTLSAMFSAYSPQVPVDDAARKKAALILSARYQTDESATFISQSLTVTKITYNFRSASPYGAPRPARQFIVVSIRLANNSDRSVPYFVSDFGIRNSAGDQIGHSFLTGVPDNLTSGNIDPYAEVTGNLGFEVPTDAADLKLIFAPRSWGGRWSITDLSRK
jgi:hypothetical protein